MSSSGPNLAHRTRPVGESTPEGEPSRDRPRVAVIVPTLNSSGSLPRLLSSIATQSYSPIDVVVVDGGSTDTTAEVAAASGATFLPGPYRRATARRVGAFQSRAEFLLFLDSDQAASPDVVADCVRVSKSAGLSAVVIPEVDECEGLWAGCRRLDRRLAEDAAISYPRFLSSAAYFAVGGHDGRVEDYMEDRDLFLRLRATGARIGQAAASLTNVMGTVRPIDLGRRGARAARDSGEYYATPRGSQERLWLVVQPRLSRLLSPRELSGTRLTTLLALPVYWLTVYGPRLLQIVSNRRA